MSAISVVVPALVELSSSPLVPAPLVPDSLVPPARPLRLTVPAGVAAQQIAPLLARGAVIRKRRLRDLDDLDDARAEKKEWVLWYGDLLARLFDAPAVAEACNDWAGRLLPDYAPISLFFEQFREEMDYRLSRLQAVVDHLETLAEDDATAAAAETTAPPAGPVFPPQLPGTFTVPPPQPPPYGHPRTIAEAGPMKRFACVCGNPLYFENTACVNCKRRVGWCAGCRKISALEPHPVNGFVCADPACRAHVLECDNYFTHNVCNRTTPFATAGNPAYCDYCRFNHTIPDLSVPGNLARWSRIEAAKRRALYDFDALGLPYGSAADGVEPPLRFDFKADTIKKDSKYRDVGGDGAGGGGEQVFTGHDSGLITINLREADPVAREKARVEFKEAHRTLVGHFRHEMGHYVWDVAIKGTREDECKAVFGDHTASYDDAMKAYYAAGPKPDWQKSYVSGYSTMHPWEDWAETFANYLDMMASLDSAQAGGLLPNLDPRDFDSLASAYVSLGLTLNELTRGIGLVDFLPELMVQPVRQKMAFIHGLTRYGKMA